MGVKYMLLIYGNQADAPDYSQYTPEEQRAAMQEWHTLMAEMKAAGVYLDTNGLAPVASATSVRVRDGQTLVTDGPFAETHEQMAGYFLLNCKDLDEAVAWAAKIPGARYGTIEVRNLWDGS
jgi:hypothetical protein